MFCYFIMIKLSLTLTIMTGQKRDMTELKFVWPVIMTGDCTEIIWSPGQVL